jgi:N-acetylneuraminic acid mutarotase
MKKIILIAIIILINDFANAQAYVWTQKANYGGTAVYDPYGFSIGSKGYVGGGRDIFMTYHSDFWEWDQATNIWTQKANMAGPARFGARGFTINNMGYVVSGYGPSGFLKDLWQYDPASNTWTQKQSHPGAARYTGIAFSLTGKGYFGLGSVFGNNYQNDLLEYDPVTNTWTTKANFIGTPRQGSSVFVINTDAYVGMGGDQSTNVDNNDFYKYDGLTNTWTQIASLPGPIRNAALSFAFSGYGFITQGYNILSAGSNAVVFDDHYRYDPSINSWTTLPNFPGQPHFEGVYFNIGIKGYIGLGSDTINYSHNMNDFWEYGPDPSAINETNISNKDINVYTVKKDILKVEFLKPSKTNLEFKITNLNGKVIHQITLDKGTPSFAIHLNEITKGIYLYSINSNKSLIKTGKFIMTK